MELWVRSQNKTILQKTNALFIAHSDYDIWSILDNQNMTKYGEYNTYERALEVLNEIQSILQPIFILDSSSVKPSVESVLKEEIKNGIVMQEYNASATLEKIPLYVYEMPKE